jgi:hypothetical protein
MKLPVFVLHTLATQNAIQTGGVSWNHPPEGTVTEYRSFLNILCIDHKILKLRQSRV